MVPEVTGKNPAMASISDDFPAAELDWMTMEVREENRPGMTLHEPGTAVSISWDPSAISVVTD